jgi:hypothetical protein
MSLRKQPDYTGRQPFDYLTAVALQREGNGVDDRRGTVL